MKKLSIVIPCYNEIENLPLLVDEIKKHVQRDDIEVVLVNNGSTDGSDVALETLTRQSALFTVVTVPVNQGYGHGILQGLRSATGTYIGWMHGDLQTSFKDALKALEVIERMDNPTDIYIKGLRKGRSLFDMFFTFGMGVFESILFLRLFYDINAQPNVFHRNFFGTWQSPPYDFSLDLYALYMARAQHLRLVRIPVIFPPRKYGRSHWNLGLGSRIRFIKRTVQYSIQLKRKGTLV